MYRHACMPSGQLPRSTLITHSPNKSSVQVPEGVIVRVQEKARMDENFMVVHLQKVWEPT